MPPETAGSTGQDRIPTTAAGREWAENATTNPWKFACPDPAAHRDPLWVRLFWRWVSRVTGIHKDPATGGVRVD